MAEVADPVKTRKDSPFTAPDGTTRLFTELKAQPRFPSTSVDFQGYLNQLGVCKPGDRPLGKPEATIGPMPEQSLWDRVRSAYYSSYTPIQTMEKTTAATRDWAISKVRGLLGPAFDRSVITDTFTQAASGLAYVVSGDMAIPIPGIDKRERPGDRQVSVDIEKDVEKYFDGDSKPMSHGFYDIRMAAGWKPDGPIKVNGVMTTLKEPVSNMLAVFVRDKEGHVELLDPSIKVNGLKEIPRVFDALIPAGVRVPMAKMDPFLPDDYKKMLTTETDADKRWRETAGRYVIGQLAPMVLTGGTMGVAKSGVIATKIPALEKAAGTIENTVKAVKGVSAPIAGSNAAAGLGAMGGQMGQSFYLTPKSIEEITQAIVTSATSPKGISADEMRANLNSALHDYTFKDGSKTKQDYVPSLRDNEAPWDLMREGLRGMIRAYHKPSDPWQEWPRGKTRVEVPELKEALAKDTRINYHFYNAVEKAMNGKPLTDQDVFIMRVGYALGPDAFSRLDIVGQLSNDKTIKYTEAERKETVSAVMKQLNVRVAEAVFKDDPAKDGPKAVAKAAADAKQWGIDLKTANPGEDFKPEQLKAFVASQNKEFGDVIEKQRQQELMEAQMRIAAMSGTMYIPMPSTDFRK